MINKTTKGVQREEVDREEEWFSSDYGDIGEESEEEEDSEGETES